MPNPYFSFKQFTVYQDKCAMKVCTDACLFGAWVAKQHKENQPLNILDIGTGTGLLPLMLAQQLTGAIETIEIDHNAYLQATENIGKSEWKERIALIHADVKEHDFKHPYDLIISNPPFYENDLCSPEMVSNIAMHGATLTLEKLLSIVASTLYITGSFAVLIPFHRTAYCISTGARFNLFPSRIVHVRQTTTHNHFRSMIVFKKHLSIKIEEEALCIKEDNKYTAAFIDLLKDYYLYL